MNYNGDVKCSICSDGFYINSDETCTACTYTNCKKCDETVCAECLTGYKFDSSNDCIQTTCTDDHCELCSSAN